MVCDHCIRRTWLLARLSGHLDLARAQIAELLELEDHALIAAVGGKQRDELDREHAGLDLVAARRTWRRRWVAGSRAPG
jgi:hypothetical protein